MTGEVRIELSGLEDWPELEAVGPALLRGARLALDASGSPLRGEVSLACLDAEAMADLNHRWLHRDGPTDVIAFDLGEREPGGGRKLIGDVYLCPDVALEAASAPGGPPPTEEMVRLVVHGVLHVLGHDHPVGEERWESPMYRLQERLVARALESDTEQA